MQRLSMAEVMENDGGDSSATKPKAGKRLPHYTTLDALRKMGFAEDMISALHPQSTPIAYFESDRRNMRDKLLHEFGYPKDKHIPSYLEGSYIIRGEASHVSGKTFLQAHANATPSSSWHASPEELRTVLQGTPAESIAERIQTVLDLPRTPKYISRAEIVSKEADTVTVELSFNRVGTQQIVIDNKQMRYADTTPIDHIRKLLEP